MGVASPAHAAPTDGTQERSLRLPVSESQRPLTLPKLVLDPDLRFDVVHQEATGTFANLGVAASLGITDDLTVGVLALPLQLSGPAGGVRYGQSAGNRGPSVDARYRFLAGRVEVAAGLTLRVFTLPGLSGGAIIPSVPVRLHVTDALRLDAALTVNITRATSETSAANLPANAVVIDVIATDPKNAVRLDVPVSARYNVTEPFDVGVTSGLTIYDLGDTAYTTGIPLGVFLGYAIAGTEGPVLDVDPYFTFPYLLMPGRGSVTNTKQFVVGVNFVGHLYL